MLQSGSGGLVALKSGRDAVHDRLPACEVSIIPIYGSFHRIPRDAVDAQKGIHTSRGNKGVFVRGGRSNTLLQEIRIEIGERTRRDDRRRGCGLLSGAGKQCEEEDEKHGASAHESQNTILGSTMQGLTLFGALATFIFFLFPALMKVY